MCVSFIDRPSTNRSDLGGNNMSRALLKSNKQSETVHIYIKASSTCSGRIVSSCYTMGVRTEAV